MKRLLFVDDDIFMHEIYKEFFSGTDKEYELVFTTNVEDAAQVINDRDVDLVFLDLIMAPLTGEYLLLKIMNDDKVRSRNIPVFLVSVLGKDHMDSFKRFKNVYSVEKPIKKYEILAKVEEVLFPADR